MIGAFVYAVLVDGERRYIGKGRGGRIGAHMKMVRSIVRRRATGESVRTTLFYNRLTKAWLTGAQIDFVIIADGLTDEAAFALEIKLIDEAGAPLWNMTPGGCGGSSAGNQVPRSAESRLQSSISNKRTWSDPALATAQGERMKVIWLRQEYREKQKKIQSAEAKALISEKAKLRWANPAFRERVKKSNSLVDASERARRGWATRRAK